METRGEPDGSPNEDRGSDASQPPRGDGDPTQRDDPSGGDSSGMRGLPAPWVGAILFLIVVALSYSLAYQVLNVPVLRGDVQARPDTLLAQGDTLMHRGANLFVRSENKLARLSNLDSPAIEAILQSSDTIAAADPTGRELTVLRANSAYVERTTPQPVSHTILLCLVALVGAIAATLHGVKSLVEFVGNGDYRKQWAMWYLSRPLVGTVLALIVHFLIVGNIAPGIETEADSAQTVSGIYTALGVAGLVGLFSKQALHKLADVFDTIFQSDRDQQLKDGLTPEPQIDRVERTNSTLEIFGSHFQPNASVLIGEQEARTGSIQPGYIKATLPSNLQGKQSNTFPDLTVQNPSGKTSDPFTFSSSSTD